MNFNSSSADNKTAVNRSWIIALSIAIAIEICLLSIAVMWWSSSHITNESITENTSLALLAPTNSATSTGGLQQTKPIIQSTEHLLPPTPSETVTTTSTPDSPDFMVPPIGKIVYTCFDGKFDQICIMNADGSNQQQLTSDNATNFYPSLSPDGEQIVFSSNRGGAFDIYIMNSRGGSVSKLTSGIGNLYAPEISPKGNRILFTAETGGIQSIWVMKIDSQNARQLIDSSGGDIDPNWSPDGSQVAFTSQRDQTTGIFITEADGSKLRGITPRNLSGVGRSSWSPMDFWLVFHAGQPGSRDVYTIGTDGKNLTQLTDGGDNLAPCYSPDGNWLAFTSYRNGNNEIYIMSLSDLQVYRLTNNPNSDWQPRWGP